MVKKRSRTAAVKEQESNNTATTTKQVQQQQQQMKKNNGDDDDWAGFRRADDDEDNNVLDMSEDEEDALHGMSADDDSEEDGDLLKASLSHGGIDGDDEEEEEPDAFVDGEDSSDDEDAAGAAEAARMASGVRQQQKKSKSRSVGNKNKADAADAASAEEADNEAGDSDSDDSVYVSDDEENGAMYGMDSLKKVLSKDDNMYPPEYDSDDDDDGDGEGGVRVLEMYESMPAAADAKDIGNDDDAWMKMKSEQRTASINKTKKMRKKEKQQIEKGEKSGKSNLFDDVNDDDDSSEDESMVNTVGNIPLEWYDEYDHIGYDKDGGKIMRRKRKDALDHFIARHDDPNYLRTVYDEVNDREVVLSNEDLENVMRVAKGQFPVGFNPYRPYVDYVQVDHRFPLSGNMRSKASFLPNKDELRIINEIAARMKRGWIKPKHIRDQEKEEKAKKEEEKYLMWGEDGALTAETGRAVRRAKVLQAPKAALPGHADSYNPPPEYVTERNKDRVYGSLRRVPQYDNYIHEVFDRCLDLYLSPRVEVKQLKVDEPKKLLPELPRPEELRPFPEIFSLGFYGHTDIVRSISVDPSGRWIVSGSNDHTVRLWEVETGRCTRIWVFQGEVRWVEWNPNPKLNLLAVAVQNFVYLIQPPESGTEESNRATMELFPSTAYTGEGEDGEDFEKEALLIEQDEHETIKNLNDESKDSEKQESADEDKQNVRMVESQSKAGRPLTLLKWTFYRNEAEKGSRKQGILVCLTHLHQVTQLAWHSRGDYFCTVSPEGYNSGIIIHHMSRRQSQRPFRRKVQEKGEKFVKVMFHPKKPLFFVATKTHVKAFDLIREKLYKRLKNGRCTFISSFDLHPTGGHVLIGGYDRRVEWFDMELTSRPYKTLRFHDKAVRATSFHKRYPLFASSSDDGTVHVYHSTVYEEDWLKDPLIVPVKILRGHNITSFLGVMNMAWHPTQPWLFTCGADKTIRLYTS